MKERKRFAIESCEYFDPSHSRAWVRELGHEARGHSVGYQESLLAGKGGFPARSFAGVRGPLVIVQDNDEIDLGNLGRGYYLLPAEIEPDDLQFARTTASALLLIDNWLLARQLSKSDYFVRGDLVLLCSDGPPTYRTRRFLHRFAKELHRPVLYLADNDVWTYFIVSSLLRGSLLAHARCPDAAVSDLRYVGLRARDYTLLPGKNPTNFLLPWTVVDRAKLECLRSHPCFRRRLWKAELQEFEGRGGKLQVDAVIALCGLHGLADLVAQRLKNGDWL